MPIPSLSSNRRRSVPLVAAVLAMAALSVIPAGKAEAFTTIYYNGAGSAPRISIIGDSTIAALRWTNMFEPLKRFNFVYDAESCRRTAIPSCRGREGYTPENTVTTMRRLSGQLGSVLVLMGGYDDPGYGFAAAVDAVMAEAVRQGIPKVMWLTLRTADVSYVGPGYVSNTYTFRDNNRILLQKAQQYGTRLQIADWATYSASRSDWFYADGIHLRPAGSTAAASFIASQAARVISGETITPAPGAIPVLPWVTVRRGDRGASVVAVQRALMERGYPVFGGADGVFGSVTEELVRRFQRVNRLPVTGVVDAATAKRLGLYNAGGTAAPAMWNELRYGMGGTGVAAAQRALMSRGITVRGGADGVFSIYTVYAVMTFQRYNALPVTGIINEATAKKLGLYSGTWIELRLGATGPRVTSAQRALIRSGIFVGGGANGTFSVSTYYAVRTFQRFQGLVVTGIIDAPTARALGLIVAPYTSSVWTHLGAGASGPSVASAQRALMNAGVFVRGGANGSFSVYTLYAVMTFQRMNGLPATGVIDVATARALGLFDLNDPATTWRDLRLGSSGTMVSNAERALMNAGVVVRNGADGFFAIDTFYAVQTYQRYHNLPVTGIVDFATARSLGLFGTPAAAQVMLLAAAPAPVAPTTAPPTTSTTTSSTSTTTSSTTTTTSVATTPPTDSADGTGGETPTDGAAIGDLVWLDADNDGLQDPGEQGVAGVVVILLDAGGVEVARVVTDQFGAYEFAGVSGGNYLVEVELPVGLGPTTGDEGLDDDVDSDLVVADPLPDDGRPVARTEPFGVGTELVEDVDLGLAVLPAAPPPASEAPTTSATPTSEPEVTTTEAAPTSTTEPVVSTEAPTTTQVEATTEPPTTVQPTTTTATTTTVAGG